MYITYRSKGKSFSEFLNMDKLLINGTKQSLNKIHKYICENAPLYSPEHLPKLKELESKLCKRIQHLEKSNQTLLQKKCEGPLYTFLCIITAGFYFLALSIQMENCDDRILEIEEKHKTFSQLLERIEPRSSKKSEQPLLEGIQKCKNLQLSNPQQELERLEKIPRVKTSLEFIQKKNNLSLEQKIAIGRSLELRESLKETHYVFNHGQSTIIMLLNIIARKLKHEFESCYHKFHETLRHDVFLSDIKQEMEKKTYFMSKIGIEGLTDHNFSTQLLSADCVLESSMRYCSALHFFLTDSNIKDGIEFVIPLLSEVIKYYFPNNKVADQLCTNLLEHMYRIPKGNNLYSICVPKQKFEESCYFSHPLGVPCHTAFEENLEKMQSCEYITKIFDYYKKESSETPSIHYSSYPQIRILTSKIKPEDGFHVILNSTMDQNVLKDFEEKVDFSLKEALTGFRLTNAF